MGVVAKPGNFFPTMTASPGPSDALMYFSFLFFNFCYPLPTTCVNPVIPFGFSGEGWGLQVVADPGTFPNGRDGDPGMMIECASIMF